MNDIKDKLIISFALLTLVGFSTALWITVEKRELEKKNAEMEQELFDIRWQLEQVDWICGVANE